MALMMLPFARIPPRVHVLAYAKIGLVLCVGHIGLIVLALAMGLNLNACIIITQMGVPFSCLLSAMFLHDPIGRWRALGLVVAFIGLAVVTGSPDVLSHQLALWVALLGAFMWAFSNMQVKQFGQVNIPQLLFWKSLAAVPVLAGISWLAEGTEWWVQATVSHELITALIYTSLGSTIAAYSLWSFLLRRYPVSMVAPFSLLTPVFGIAAGQWFFDASFSMELILGGLLTILGVAVITIRRPKLSVYNENL